MSLYSNFLIESFFMIIDSIIIYIIIYIESIQMGFHYILYNRLLILYSIIIIIEIITE